MKKISCNQGCCLEVHAFKFWEVTSLTNDFVHILITKLDEKIILNHNKQLISSSRLKSRYWTVHYIYSADVVLFRQAPFFKIKTSIDYHDKPCLCLNYKKNSTLIPYEVFMHSLQSKTQHTTKDNYIKSWITEHDWCVII